MYRLRMEGGTSFSGRPAGLGARFRRPIDRSPAIQNLGSAVGQSCSTLGRLEWTPPDMTGVRMRIGLTWIGLIVAAVFVGCRPNSPDKPQDVSAANEVSIDPQALWRRVCDTYASADRYHDDGKFVLRYRLNDRPMEEHQLWAVDFDRSGRQAVRIFNARVHSDGERTTVRVFDWGTENMDNQVVVQPGVDLQVWTRLHQDPVARHFLLGVGELPFAPDLDPRCLVPIVTRLLQGLPADDALSTPAALRYVGTETLDGRPAHQLLLGESEDALRFWIDPDSATLRQIELPLSWLDPALLQSPEISGLRLIARLENATFQPEWSDDVFPTRLSDDCHPVRAFVPLPERFPCERIGAVQPPLDLWNAGGSAVRWEPAETASKTLVWIDGSDSSRQVLQALSDWDTESLHFIYLDYRPNPAEPAAEPAARVRALAAAHPDLAKLPVWFDLDNAAGKQVEIAFAPTAILIDAQGVVQYFQTLLEPDWESKLKSAIQRVAAGDDLAGEMRAEYRSFLDKYRERLAAANPLAPAAETVPDQRPAPVVLPQLEPIWEFTDARQPGNLLWDPPSQTLIAMDGWQSIVAIDLQTRRAHRFPLPVDPAVALTRLRSLPSAGVGRFAAFSDLGSAVHLFDADWKSVASIPAASPTIDVQMYTSRSGAAPELLVLTNDQKVQRISLDTGEVGEGGALELAAGLATIPPDASWAPSDWYGAMVRADGSCALFSNRLDAVREIRVPDLRLVRVSLGRHGRVAAVGIGLDPRGDWVAVGIDRDGKVAWTQIVGGQTFDRQIEPLVHWPGATADFWAIAGSDSTITVLDDRGRLLQRWQCPEAIQGIAWAGGAEDAESQENDARCTLAISLATRIVFVSVELDQAGGERREQ